ncbi:efflux RND transporter periplasmic adaptor subunit [Longibacter sp.]|uniref:efflux RND transporter periplasmic adaptor subunit n=1 Tax=Longibacter sp. TaxID=2045415 RepID=UPI003EBD4DC7
MMDPIPRMLPLAGVPLLVLALVLLGCTADADPVPPASTVPVVETVPAEAATTPLPIRTSGRLVASTELPLSFKIGGVVARVLVDEGERVSRGQTLARLDLSEINARVAEAESALEKARRDLERTRTLQQDSVATVEELQDAGTAVEVAEARLDAARFNRKHAVITAPSGGRVLQRMVEAGETVSGGQPILALGADASGFVLRVGLPDEDIVMLTPGDSASVRLRAFGDRSFPARVTEIAGAASRPAGTFNVELRIDRTLPDRFKDRLRSGFTGTADIFPKTPTDHVLLPASALVEGDGRTGIVFEVADARDSVGTAQRRQVDLVGFEGSHVAIRGLDAGTPVITRGGPGLRDGDAVRLAPAHP